MTEQRPSPAEVASLPTSSQRPAPADAQDRHIHGRAVILQALALGACAGAVLSLWNSSLPWRGLVNVALQAAILGAIVAATAHRQRRTLTWPRHARRTTLVGITGTGVLYVAIATSVYLGGAAAPTAWVSVGIGAVVALPGVVAGVLIARDRR
ncbi:hypothetical protein [Isoptericola sediminis]|uniref:Transmembrane protein n=1 Tax=Isoptericola sediminis TaxID=2733572 RepID=A0A849JZ85_9MICO|nr:hypothetical protein [Isoptericola sediminis]NNU28592.1 hypothetical protein [Isoptericola sediminis]